MGRKRQYANAAERLKAFRARAARDQAKPSSAPVRPLVAPKGKISRPARLMAIENDVRALIDDYRAWRERLPESLKESGMAGKLDEAIELLAEVAETLASIDLPKGFGRD